MDLIVLDRDGVINQDSDAYIKSPPEWIALPGSVEAIARLNQAGYRVVVITNQSGIARGLLDLSALARIHQKLRRQVAEASPAIWRQWDRFQAQAARVAAESRKLADVAASGDPKAIRVQFFALERACAACHDAFRVKKR